MFVLAEGVAFGLLLPVYEVQNGARVICVFLCILIVLDGVEFLDNVLFDKVEGRAKKAKDRQEFLEGLDEAVNVDVFRTAVFRLFRRLHNARFKRIH